MPNNTNIEIIFRSKFQKHIKCDAEKDVFLDAFQKFIALDPETAIDMLWRLTFAPRSEILWKIGLYGETIPEEMAGPLRNELRYQYELAHPQFLAIEVADECNDAFSTLNKQADSIVAFTVHKHCCSHLYHEDTYMERMLFLLGSEKENNHFGGIRSLGFTVQEAEHLKPFHMQIHNLFKAMYEQYRQRCNSSPLNTPFEELAQRIEESGNDLPFEWNDPTEDESSVQESAQEPVQYSSAYRRLIAEAVIMHKDVFTSFVQNNDMNALVQLSELGFDLNEVMSKREKVFKLLQAIAEKEKAEEKLFEAHQALNS